jgi:hypothetical protein
MGNYDSNSIQIIEPGGVDPTVKNLPFTLIFAADLYDFNGNLSNLLPAKGKFVLRSI